MSEKEKNTSGKKWKKVIQLTAAYLVAAWTFLQFVDWTLVRYQISPYWVDILLWLFVGVLPSFIICIYNLERISKGTLKLREKILVPMNVLLLGVLLFFFFGNSDLGSTTKEISFTDELGNIETQTITKEEFRIGVPIFNFDQVEKDSTYEWLGETINKLIKLDLDQDKNITPDNEYADNTTDKVKYSSIFNEYYVDGEYQVSGDEYIITPIIRNSKNGKEIQRKTFSGKDFFSLIDEISIYIKSNVGLINELTQQYIDLEIKDITTHSLEALKLWMKRDYEGAVALDEDFALAYFYNAARRSRYSQGELEEKYLIDKAYQNKSKLPTQVQFEILMYKHIIYERWEDAKELIKYQLEFEPENETFNYLLDIVYSETRDIDALYKHAYERFTKNKSENTAQNYFTALIFKGEYEKALRLVKTFELLAPNVEQVFLVKAFTYLSSGDYENAKKTYKKIDVTWPKDTHYKKGIQEFIKEKEENNKPIEINPEIFDVSFRSAQSEQEIRYFKKEDALFVSYKNQLLWRGFVSEKNKLLVFSPGDHFGLRFYFEKDSLGNLYRAKTEQFSGTVLSTFYYYTEPDEIKEAYIRLENKNLKKLDSTFESLAKKYPKHWFLLEGSKHLKFIKKKSKKQLLDQYKKIVGTYSSRKFWVENDRLYYKRGGLPKVEIFPISETQYISLSKNDTRYEFEFLKGGKIASFAWTYDIEKEQWEPMKDENNYLLKN